MFDPFGEIVIEARLCREYLEVNKPAGAVTSSALATVEPLYFTKTGGFVSDLHYLRRGNREALNATPPTLRGGLAV